ncbi:MAG: hypothetical protein NC184_00185 [Roseburia sp.]|nr:hypothetical protein [Roseburia sp.]
MEFIELKKHLKSSPPCAGYYCYGDDDYVINRAVGLIKGVVTDLQPLNIVDREFTSAQNVVEELMQLPVMSEYRVVVARGKFDVAPISEYLSDPNTSSVLVMIDYIPHDSWGHAAAPKFPNGITAVNCNRLQLKYILSLVRKTLDTTGSRIGDVAAETLYKRCGGYLTRIMSEAEKLSALRANDEITVDDINESVYADTEFAVFELSDCILKSDAARAVAIVNGMAKNNDLVAAYTLLYNRFKRIFAAAVDPDSLAALGVKPNMVGRLVQESKRFSKARLRTLIDTLEKSDYAYKTGAVSQYDALVGFVVKAAYGG